MRTVIAAIVLLLAVLPPCPAAAATITFTGGGTVDQITGRLTPTGAAPIGSALSFSFTFDPSSATLYEADQGYAFYDVPVAAFGGGVGGVPLALDPDPRFGPGIEFVREFSFFGGPVSEPSLAITFYLPGPTVTATTAGGAFLVSPGSRETLSLTALFRAGAGETAVDIGQLRDPAGAAQLTFAYAATDPVVRRSGALRGTATGGFATASAVPEPAVWMMMIMGIGMAGAVARRRHGAPAPFPAPAPAPAPLPRPDLT